MAFTVTKTQHSSGDQRMVLIECTADATSGTFDSGLGVITGGSISSKSGLTGQIKFNQSAGVAANGKVNVHDCTSGSDFYIICFGR